MEEQSVKKSHIPRRRPLQVMPKEKRRHSWAPTGGGGGGGRMSFSGRLNTLTTIGEEQSPISPPQANSTRLDDTMCPFENFELELMRDRKCDFSDIVEDTKYSILEEPTLTARDATIYNCDKSVDLTLVSQSRTTPRHEGTPPFVLRQRINSMTTIVQDVVKEYDELREFTTLEKQFHTEEINNIIEGLKQENSSLKLELESSEEKRRETEAKLEAADEKITSLENELFTYKENILEMEDKLLKNMDTDLLQELAELKIVNARIEEELKMKADDFQKLKEQADEVNTNYVKVTAEKDKLQTDIRQLINKVKELETVNSDLEVTLDHKSRKSIERETELENELKAAWQALESREKMMRKEVIDKECLQLKKITIEDKEDAYCTDASDEIDRTVNDSNPVEATKNDTTEDGSKSPEPTDVTLNNTTLDLNATVEATETSNFIACDATLDLNATVEATERSNFIACDATFSNISILSPVETSDPLKSFCLNESMMPVVIHAEDDETASQINTSVFENKILIQDLCDMLGDKDQLKQKIVEMKSEAADILKEYEDKKSDLSRITEQVSSYEAFIKQVKQALNLEGDDKCIDGIEKEINNLKMSKDNMEASFKSEIDKLQVELDVTRRFEQVVVELSRLVDADSTSDVALTNKITDLVQFKTQFVSKLGNVLFPNRTTPISSEEELVLAIQSDHASRDRMLADYKEMSDAYDNVLSTKQWDQERVDLVEEKFEKLLDALDLPFTKCAYDFPIEEAEQMRKDAMNGVYYSKQIIDLHNLIGKEYDEKELSCEAVKNAIIDLNRQLDTLKSNHGEYATKLENLTQEIEDKSNALNQLIDSIQECTNITCSEDNVVDCMKAIHKELSEMRSSLKEQSSKLTDNEGMKDNLQLEIDVLLEKVKKFESFTMNIHSLLKSESNNASQNNDEKSNTLLESIQNAEDLELQVQQLLEDTSSLVKHKEVLEKICSILSDNSDAIFSIENILDEMTKYKAEFVDMQYQLDKLEDCQKRIPELEKQIEEIGNSNKVFTDVFGRIRGELDVAEDVTIDSLPGLIIQMKNQTLTSSDRLHKLEEFVDNCYTGLNVYCDLSSDDKLGSIVNKIHDLVVDIESTNEENISLNQYKKVLQEIFQIFSENVLSIENIIPVLTGYKMEFGEMRLELERMDDCMKRISELENKVQEIETINKHFASVYEKILTAFVDEDLTVESLPERIIQIKNEAMTCSDVALKLQQFVNSCVSALSVGFDASSANDDDKLSAILFGLQQLAVVKSESVAVSEENAILSKHKQILEKIIQTLSEDSDEVITVENIVDVLTKYKTEFVEMHEKLEKIDENASEVSDLKRMYNTFAQVFEKVSNEIEGFDADYEIEKLPEVINRMKNELNDLQRFKVDVNNLMRIPSNDESNAICSSEELISSIKDTEKKIASLNEKLESAQEENSRLTEISNNFVLKLKEYMSIGGIISSLGSDLGCEMQTKIEEILERQIESPELNKQIEKLVEFNRLYLELENKLGTTIDDMKVYEDALKKLQCAVGVDDVNNIENAVNGLKNDANELTAYKNVLKEISGHLSTEQDSSFSSENILPSIVNLKNQISVMTEKMETLEARNAKLSEAFEDLDSKMKYIGDVELVLSSISSVLGVESREEILYAVEDMKRNLSDLKNDATKIASDNDTYLETIQCLFKKLSGENILPCDEELRDSLISKADSMSNEISRMKDLLNGIKQLLSDLSEVDLQVDDEVKLEDVKNAIEDIKKNLCEVYELKIENKSIKSEVEAMKEKMQSHFECVDIVFNLCNLLSETIGKTIAKCDILKIVDSLLHNGTIPSLNESSVVDMEEAGAKVSEIDALRKELSDLKSHFNNLAIMFNAEGLTDRGDLVECVNNLKNDYENLVSKCNSMQSECTNYKDSLTDIIKSVFESFPEETSLEERIKLLTERFHALKQVENAHGEIVNRSQQLVELQNSINEELGLANSDSTVDTLKVLKLDLENFKKNVHELQVQLDVISSEKVDLKEKVDCIISVIKENPSIDRYDDQECFTFDFYKCKLLKMIEDYNSHVDFYKIVCNCLSDRVEDVSKESVCSAIASIKNENNCLNRSLQEMSANNERIISDLNAAYETVMSKLELSKENEQTVEQLKELVLGEPGEIEGDLVQSVTNLIDEKSKMDARLQEMLSEISMMKSSMTDNQNAQSEFNKCQSLLRAMQSELDMSDEDHHSELLDAIRELKSKSDQAQQELSAVTDQLRKCTEYLNIELLKLNGKIGEDSKKDEILESMQLLCGNSLLEQLKSDSTELVNLCNCKQATLNNLKSEIDVLGETVKNFDTTNSDREALFQRLRHELEIQSENNESVFDSIAMLKDNLQQLRNENTCVMTTNEELRKTSEALKVELDESAKNVEFLKSEKDSLNEQVKANTETIDQLRVESQNLNIKLSDSSTLIASKDEIIRETETQLLELKNNVECNGQLVENLKSEIASQQKVIEDLRNEMKRIESVKMSENQGEDRIKIEETLKELNQVKQKLDDFIAVDKTLKKKLITEIKNMKSDFKPGRDEETSVQLLDSFVAVVMEKYQEVIMTLNQNFEVDKKSLKERINQLESKEKKTKEWIEQLEAETDITNQDINAKNVEIERLTEIVKKHENESARKSEDLEKIREDMKNCEVELNLLRTENKEMAEKLKDQLSEQNHSASDSMKLRESLDRAIAKQDALSNELSNKAIEISQLKSTIDSQQQELKSYFNKLNEKQALLDEKNLIASNLTDKNEACLQEIEDLKQELKKEKDECDRLSSSLNTLKAEYSNVQQSLETYIKANEALESKLEEFSRDMIDTKAMAANLVESLKSEEQKAQAKMKALEKINEEKTNECNDLKTKIYLFEMEMSKYNSTQGETLSKMKEEVDAVNKMNKVLSDNQLEKEKLIRDMKLECHRLEKKVADYEIKFEEFSRTLSVLHSDVIKKDQELNKLQNLKEEIIKLQECLKDEETKCAELSSKNCLLEKDLVDRMNQITKLQSAMEKYEKELQEVRASSNVELDQIKIQLKNSEDVINTVSNKAALLEKQITKLKSDIICKDEDLSKMRKEVSRLSVSLEEVTKSELRHQPKKLKLNALNKFENFGCNEKENDVSLKLNTSHNTPQQQIGGCLKCRKLEKEMGLLFKPPVEGDMLVEKMKQSLVKLEEFESNYNSLQTEYKELDAECEDLNTQIKSLETECTNLVYKSDELTQNCNKLKDDHEKELATNAMLKKKNENLTKDLDACGVELERCREMLRGSRRERSAALHGSFRESDNKRYQAMDLSASEAPSTPVAGDFKSIKHRWEQMSTSTQKHQPTPSKECQCEDLMKQNQDLKLELADKNNKVTLLEIQIQGQNFPYKKKAATLEEDLNEAKTKIMTLKQEVRRLQTCLHDVSVFQSCETCRNKAKASTAEAAVQTTVTDTEASVSGSEIIQRQSVNVLKEKTAKLERENMLLKR
ncbi:reticulocyte-binding protein PFD0110w [Nilaparvata lugens]|uniref:reticulocyte-binding protein PFD0110w n=1 Tax=Nilaparvata lugens TaxID=108931 RepID=UPI00193C8FD5|nr:reticulocyte-binding protein PFD0110w [Nilaparvata lugens]